RLRLLHRGPGPGLGDRHPDPVLRPPAPDTAEGAPGRAPPPRCSRMILTLRGHQSTPTTPAAPRSSPRGAAGLPVDDPVPRVADSMRVPGPGHRPPEAVPSGRARNGAGRDTAGRPRLGHRRINDSGH